MAQTRGLQRGVAPWRKKTPDLTKRDVVNRGALATLRLQVVAWRGSSGVR